MAVELRITSGSRAGQRELFEKSVITIGRHPSNDFRFHPELDRDVSSRHAELRVAASKATIHDLNSTNGTFVNGQRVEGARPITNGDVISFGMDGPQVEFRTVRGAAEPAPTRMENEMAAKRGSAAAASAGDLLTTRASRTPGRDTTVRIAEAVEAQTGRLRTMVIGLAVLVVSGIGGTWWMGRREAATVRTALDAALRRNDSLSAAFDLSVSSMRGKVAGLDSALMLSKADGERLRSQIRADMEKGSDVDVNKLTLQLSAAENRQRALTAAARVNYEEISRRNAPAIVFIAVNFVDGAPVSASGFNVSPSGLVVTNRHVVQDEKGRPATAVLVAFEGTTGQWKKARVVKVSATDDLAFIKVEDRGPYPVVTGVAKNPGLQVGAPAAIIGYPFGTSTAGMSGGIDKLTPQSTLGVATVAKVLSETLQLDAYAAEGSSGSPVLDARGFVVGVVYGGQSESHGRIVYAVPGEKLVAEMPKDGATSIK